MRGAFAALYFFLPFFLGKTPVHLNHSFCPFGVSVSVAVRWLMTSFVKSATEQSLLALDNMFDEGFTISDWFAL